MTKAIKRSNNEAQLSGAYYALRFKIEDRSLDDEDDDNLVQEFSGEIVHHTETQEIVVGKVQGARFDLGGALERRIPFFEVFERANPHLADYYGILFDHETRDFRKQLNLASFGDVLIIHSIEIVQEHRGFNLGLLSMLQTIRTFGGGCAVAAIKPYPLQFSGKENRDEQEFVNCQKKLRTYWQKFGFRRIGKTEYYSFDLVDQLPRPQEFLSCEKKS